MEDKEYINLKLTESQVQELIVLLINNINSKTRQVVINELKGRKIDGRKKDE